MEERFSGPITFKAIDFYRNRRRGEVAQANHLHLFEPSQSRRDRRD